MLGSGAIMVFDEDTNPALVAWRLLKFFAHESCGKCTPCREGSMWLERVLFRISHGLGRPQDLDLMLSFGSTIVAGAQRAVRADHHLRDGTEHDVGGGEPRPLLPRGDPRDVQRRRRPPDHPGDERMSAASTADVTQSQSDPRRRACR